VASLRRVFHPSAEQIDVVKRDTQSDEVFALLQGRRILVIAGRGPKPGSIQPLVMEQGRSTK